MHMCTNQWSLFSKPIQNTTEEHHQPIEVPHLYEVQLPNVRGYVGRMES